MKKFLGILFFSSIGFVLLQSFGFGFGKRDGTEPGFTGSPGDSLKNCTVCHGGTSVKVEGWITSNIPVTGYVPGQRYTITATNTNENHNRFGFLVSPQAINGTLLGTIIVTDTTNTKSIGDNKYVTYRANSVFGLGSRSWTFDWIAPTEKNVVFYGAFNSNHDGHKGGEVTQLTQLKVWQQGFVGLDKIEPSQAIAVYPNPVVDMLTVNFKNGNIQSLKVVDIRGNLVQEIPHFLNTQIDMSHLSKGIYFIQIITEESNKVLTQKIVKL